MKKFFAIAVTIGVLALSSPFTSANAGPGKDRAWPPSSKGPIVMCGYAC